MKAHRSMQRRSINVKYSLNIYEYLKHNIFSRNSIHCSPWFHINFLPAHLVNGSKYENMKIATDGKLVVLML